jgi:hypothetical protein
MGSSGRQYIVSRLSRERTAHGYMDVLQNLKNRSSG